MSAPQVDGNALRDAARLDRVAFWYPLPSGNGLSAASRRLVQQSDADINARRYESALDSSLELNAVAPEFIPGYVRTTELLIATQRTRQARSLASTISRFEAIRDSNECQLALAKIAAHVDPRLENIVSVARALLESGTNRSLLPYVPAAIDALAASGQFQEANDLARAWADTSHGNAIAYSYLIREQLRNGPASDASSTIQAWRAAHDLDRVWPEHVIASGIAEVSRRDEHVRWSALAPGCLAIRNKRLSYEKVVQLLEFLVEVLDDHRRALIAAGLYAVNAGDLEEARALLETITTGDGLERFLVGAGLARIASETGDDQLHKSSLTDAFEALTEDDVAEFAGASEIFEPPATRGGIGIELATAYRDNEQFSDALEILNRLRQLGEREPRLDRLHAEIIGQTGSRTEAIEELGRILKRQEQENQHRAAIQTLESMVRLVPGNLTLRNKLVDKYLRIGQFNEAINQLVLQARLLHRANRTHDATPAMHRAIEIATMVNDWHQVDYLHKLMISFDPDDTSVRHSAVATYVQHGRTEAALDQLREIARIARERNDPDEAIAASHQMLALAPDEPSTYHQLGELLLSIEEYGQAERVYRRLAAITPDDPSIAAKRSAIAAMARNRQP